MKPGEGVFDRIEQSFDVLFSSMRNFTQLVGPIFLYKLVIGIFLWNFVSFVLLGSFDASNIEELFSPYFMVIFFLIIVGFLLYITFFIGVLLATMKTIKDIFEEKEVNLRGNIKYGINSIIPSFNTYWYIFAYIALIPFYIITFGGVLFIIGSYLNIENLSFWGIRILFLGFLVLLIFMIYRGVKSNFALPSAVDKNEYTKENFLISVKITDSNWWRIVGNFFLLSIFIWIIFSIINAILAIFGTSIWDIIDVQGITQKFSTQSFTPEDQKELLLNIQNYYSSFYLNNFIISIFNLFFEIIKYVFVLIFTYIFYKRLYLEKFGDKIEIIKEKIEL